MWDFPRKNTGVGCHVLFQGIFPTQGSNPRLLQWQADSLPRSPLGSPDYEPAIILLWGGKGSYPPHLPSWWEEQYPSVFKGDSYVFLEGMENGTAFVENRMMVFQQVTHRIAL